MGLRHRNEKPERQDYQKIENICMQQRRVSERRRLEMEMMLGKEQDIVQRGVAIAR